MPDPALPLNLVTNLAFLLVACAFLVRDILHLRLLAMLANLGLIYGAFHNSALAGAPHLYWYAAFFGINGVHSALLFYQRNLLKLTPEEAALRDRAFPALDAGAVKRVLRGGTWLDVQEGGRLTCEGELPDRVWVVARGEAEVTLNGRSVARVMPGEFVGEIAFLSDRPATATVVAGAGLRCLAWPRTDLKRRVARDGELHAALYAAMGQNLAEKVAAADVAIARGA